MSSRPELKVNLSSTVGTVYLPVFLQVDDEVGFIRFYRALPDKGMEGIRIFDRGDWYTAHGDDAEFIARTVRYG